MGKSFYVPFKDSPSLVVLSLKLQHWPKVQYPPPQTKKYTHHCGWIGGIAGCHQLGGSLGFPEARGRKRCP